MSDNSLQTLIDKQAIRDVLSRYCRGLDRMDKRMARDVWHPDGTALYEGMFEGTGHGFIDWVWNAHAAMERHSHQITNVLIELDPNEAGGIRKATSEAYVTVVLWTQRDAAGGQRELVGRGRYLDRWECRGGRWAIEHRIHLLDMSSDFELNRAEVSVSSTRDETDLSFAFIPKA